MCVNNVLKDIGLFSKKELSFILITTNEKGSVDISPAVSFYIFDVIGYDYKLISHPNKINKLNYKVKYYIQEISKFQTLSLSYT